ncbi:Transcriptional regulatory protein TdiR [Stieleria neptunia]|uniref:Transcriptional regulatory protein TdiR n=1 Tax=Stieleria neptunia TaxID=2527979 RepID=A0A518HHJ5_9BACT|nr:response regulator [Stieleria neptunia]QDV40325.1 Transcriptional regulatory protein TdiR [Stieleria neptunia]
MPETTTLFLIDPDPSARRIVGRIADQMNIDFRHYTSAEDFLEAYTRQTPGCIVAEFRLLGISGNELQNRLVAEGTSLPIIFVSAFAEIPFAVQAMTQGAINVLEKPVSEQALWDSIQHALACERRVRRIDAKHAAVGKRLARLTCKEREVFDLLVQGHPNKTIANRLGLSIRTVEARRHHIFRKTGTKSLAQLVRMVVETERRRGGH